MASKLKQDIIKKIEVEKIKVSNLYRIKSETVKFTEQLFLTLFDKETDVTTGMNELEKQFKNLADLVCFKEEDPCREIWTDFMKKLPDILQKLNNDACFIKENDPAANSIDEVYLAYPGFYAIAIYRLSHALLEFGLPIVPRLMSECAHTSTGTDINPGAKIGNPFFIDHATGVVIGETSEIEDRVKIYQGVTLGALSVDKTLKHQKRHPTIKSDVTIYANATILGGKTVIGEGSTIGGNVWLTKSIPGHSTVSHKSMVKINENKNHE
ncbi:serine O-acetyltransferase [Psychroflexus salinarum]|uniref:Serine O-acetyltransferase n=1 Tax=Psychroflexus salinarum TaxID=546024 RepID=A0ABW3GSF8_9FLAO